MKILLAMAVSVLALGTMTNPVRDDASAARLRALLAQEQERKAAAALCAEQDASAFQHVESGRFTCVSGSRRVSSPLSNPLQTP